MLVIGRIKDDNEPQFRLAYRAGEGSRQAGGVEAVRTPGARLRLRDAQREGVYDPDPAQKQIVADAIAYFNSCLK